MLENQFIRTDLYRSYLGEVKSRIVLYGTYGGVHLFLPEGTTSIVVIRESEEDYTYELSNPGTYNWVLLSTLKSVANIADNVDFVLKFRQGKFSEPLRFIPKTSVGTDDVLFLRYKCDDDAFGFPFHSAGDKYAGFYTFIRAHSPQEVQEDKTYVKANGEVVTLYAKYYKEWECETEYLSEKMHDKIIAALSCDEVYFDNKRVTKSDKYQIDWDKYDLDCDGTTKLAKATFKVREHVTQRNSNF